MWLGEGKSSLPEKYSNLFITPTGLTQNCPSGVTPTQAVQDVRQGGVAPLGRFCVSPVYKKNGKTLKSCRIKDASEIYLLPVVRKPLLFGSCVIDLLSD
jgi:hypothetical protein